MDSTHFFYALMAGVLPSLLWLWFWLREDHLHPEPRAMIIDAFIMGMVAVIIAIPLQKLGAHFIATETYQYIYWAAVEECVKFALAFIIAFHSINMDEPIDAIIYLITVALGFAALENSLFALGSLHNDSLVQSILNSNMRFIGATLLHVVSSSCIGLALGLTFYMKKSIRIVAGTIGLVAAIALHSFFNLSIIASSAFGILKIFAWVWCGAIILLMFFEEVKAVHPKEKAL